MKRNTKRAVATLLASVLLFTDCVSGFAAETDSAVMENEEQGEVNELEILDRNDDVTYTEAMQEEFAQESETEEEDPQVLFEVEELRDQYEKSYRLSDGTILAAQYGMDVHYEDENENWEEIDNRFLYESAENEQDFSGYRSAEGAVEFKFAPQAQEGELLKITYEDYRVGFELLPPEEEEQQIQTAETDEEPMEAAAEGMASENDGEQNYNAPISFLKGEVLNPEEVPEELARMPAVLTTGEETETVWVDMTENVPEEGEAELLEAVKVEEAVTSVGYGNVFPGVSLQYILQGSSLKEYILVNERSDVYSYDFSMNLEKLEPEMQEDGSIILKDDESGTAVYEIPAGYMTDASGEYSDAVEMSVSENGEGSWVLNITADAEWINAEEREFPVQIDPTIAHKINSLNDIRGSYVVEGSPGTSYTQTENLLVGYDKNGGKQLRTYIQLRNLPTLPKNSVICAAMCYLGVESYVHNAQAAANIRVKKAENTSWSTKYTWNSKPEISSTIMDYREISGSSVGKYFGWNITELVKDHYKAGNTSGQISAFALEAYGGTSMSSSRYSKTELFLTENSNYPILQVVYRDTKGLENYYTYQAQDAGNAGTAYVGDYNGQLVVVKPAVFYNSTIMSCGINLVYNSSYCNRYFTMTEDIIYTKNFTNMKVAAGWKLSIQETVVEVSLEDVAAEGTSQTTWLVYNDADGTEHYFKKSESDPAKYEDEDGLNLTIQKNGSDYTMTDKKGNSKFFKNGYLTKISDANGNHIHIIYNGNSYTSNVPNPSTSNRITAVQLQVKGYAPKDIFVLTYNASNYLINIRETYGQNTVTNTKSLQIDYVVSNSIAYLKGYRIYNGSSYVESVRYEYNSGGQMSKIFDVETGLGVEYTFAKSPTGYRVSGFKEYSQNENGGTGRAVTVSAEELKKTVYTDHGTDRNYGTSDDIITTYIFNNSGQTINANSKDRNGTLLGVTASAYSENSGTKKTNNRLLQSVGTGRSGVSLLKNGGFERYTDNGQDSIADGWIHSSSVNGKAACRNGEDYSTRSGKMQYNVYNGTTSNVQKIYQLVNLKAGTTYTASAYVNTQRAQEFAPNGGAYMKITDTSETMLARGAMICEKTTEHIDGGWQRISVTYTATADFTARIYVVWENVKGTLRVDDMQLEIADAASSFNLVYNGSFEEGETGWTLSDLDLESVKTNEERLYGSNAFRTNGYPGSVLYAEQIIDLKKSSDTTFMLSGWSKGDAIPELEKICDETTDQFWGITVKFTYSDGSTEKHHLPFNEFVHEWQYASMAVVPKKSGMTLLSAVVRVCFFNVANVAYFDNISFTEEPAQTYTYDEKGNLTSVKSSGNGKDDFEYDGNSENLIKTVVEGVGTYTYQYDDRHLPTTISNGKLHMNVQYDQYGEAQVTTLINEWDKQHLQSGAAYSDGLLMSKTENTNVTTYYTYNERRELKSTTNGKGQVLQIRQDDTWNRMRQTYQSGKLSLDFGYDKGMLTSIQRGGYISLSGEKQYQTYSFGYDMFGNRTSVAVKNAAGNQQVLATYTYNGNNGTLKKMTYGPSNSAVSTVDYTYDKLDRVKTVKYSDAGNSTTYGYRYSADGSLSGITVNNEPAYDYAYDSLGRLIYSAKLQNKRPVLYTSHQYDTSDRLKKQSWQIGNDSFTESYTYDQTYGVLIEMSSGGDILEFQYNSLKMPAKRLSPRLDMTYNYQVLNSGSGRITNRVESVAYELKPDNGTRQYKKLNYTYDELDNITCIKEGDTELAKYTYDEQNQLIREELPSQTLLHDYDTYGNIRLKKTFHSNGDFEQRSYIYGNDIWKDQLTAMSYMDTEGEVHYRNFTYDEVGNPLAYDTGKKGWLFTWKKGRQLATATSIDLSIINTYDVDGIRDSKTVRTLQNGTVTGSVRHDYTTLGGKIIREAYGANVIDYFYDNNGRPYKIVVKAGSASSVTGYFVLNLQGDVIGIIDGDGTVAVEYQYDAWGKEISHTTVGDDGSTLYNHNALKYRGYYYDSETGFYYVSSRYYDPEIGRFISADSAISGVGGDIRGYNMYSYCFNNPVNMSDPDGNWPRWISATVAAIATVVAVVTAAPAAIAVAAVAACTYVAQTIHYDVRQSKNTNLPNTPKEADDAGWRNSKEKSPTNLNGGGPADSLHQYSSKDKSNVKYVSPDGHREVIFNNKGEIVVDPRDIGTYNFIPSGNVLESLGHGVVDVIPWFFLGNTDDDWGPIINFFIN